MRQQDGLPSESVRVEPLKKSSPRVNTISILVYPQIVPELFQVLVVIIGRGILLLRNPLKLFQKFSYQEKMSLQRQGVRQECIVFIQRILRPQVLIYEVADTGIIFYLQRLDISPSEKFFQKMKRRVILFQKLW